MDKTCNCQVQGIAILPVRYTVVPTYINRPQPNWANLPSVTTIPLSEGYQYHVRSLREGYLYVYLPAEKGNDKWQIYSIDDQGRLLKQYSNNTIKSSTDTQDTGAYNCPNLTQNNPHYSFITIPNPKYQQKIYITYSEFMWSDETLEKHEKEPAKRMQLVEPEKWKAAQSHSESAIVATQKNIQHILDYDPEFNKNLLPYDEQHLVKLGALTLDKVNEDKTSVGSIYHDILSYDKNGKKNNSEQTGKAYGYDEKVFNKNTTCHPWNKQSGKAEFLARSMEKYSEGYSPILIAIDDSLGIAQELNGYYNEIFGKNEQYRQEREWEFNTKESYEYAMQILAIKASSDDFAIPFTEHPYLKRVMQVKKIERSAELPIFSHYNQLSVLIYHELYGRTQSLPYVQNMIVSESFGSNLYATHPSKNIYNLERQQRLYGNDLNQYDQQGINAYHSTDYYRHYDLFKKTKLQTNLIDGLEREVNRNLAYYINNEENFKSQREEEINKIRKKYAKHFNSENFDKAYEQLLVKIAETAEDRVQQVINWLKQSQFYVHLQDLDGNNNWIQLTILDEQLKTELDNQFEIDEALADNEITEAEAEELKKVNLYGMLYSSIIERSTAGFELTEKGKSQIEQWFSREQAKSSKSDSLMWRGLANNNDNILFEINQLLDQASKHNNEISIDEVYASTKIGKLASYYKKTQGFFNTIERYRESIDKVTDINSKYSDTLQIAKGLGTTLPKDGRLLKFVLSKPNLMVNNLILRASNVIFFPVNVVAQIPNTILSYLFHFSLCGVGKSGADLFIRSQHAINSHILSSPLQLKVNLAGGVIGELTNPQRKEILERNAKYIRLSKEYSRKVRKLLNNEYRDRVTNVLKEDSKTMATIKPTASKAVKDARLALIIGVFEAYNWWQLNEKQKALNLDEFWTLEMTKSTLALSAAMAEMVAQYTKAVRGSNSLAFGRTKVLSGFMGMSVSFFLSLERLQDFWMEYQNERYLLMSLNLINSINYLVLGSLTFLSSFTYHIPWLERKITQKALSRGFSNAVIKRALVIHMAKFMARRALLLGLGFWVGIIALVIEGLIWWLTDDDLEEWLQYSIFGTQSNHKAAYQDIYEQKQKFKQVLESMFGINQDILNINQKNQITVKANALSTANEQLDSEFNEYDALLLIEQDLKQQKQLRENVLAKAPTTPNPALTVREEVDYINVHGYSVQDIFSGKLN